MGKVGMAIANSAGGGEELAFVWGPLRAPEVDSH